MDNEPAIRQVRPEQSCVELTAEDVVAIKESDAQIDRGESVEFDAFAAEMRETYCSE
jgi:hypothetical protein